MYKMEDDIKKPPRPWSADINYKRPDQRFYTSKSDTTHDKYGRYETCGGTYKCCVDESRNPPNTPVNPKLCSRQQVSSRAPVDEGRCIRLRTISHSAPPLNFTSNWNPLVDRHPGSAFDVVSSASSSRTCTPDQTESRAELCVSKPELYTNPIIKPIPRRCSSMKKIPLAQIADCNTRDSEEETLPDRLFKAQIAQVAQTQQQLRNSILMLEVEQPDSSTDRDNDLTLPDKLFKAHMAKLAMESDHTAVKPKIISQSSSKSSLRNGLKDKFVLNIIENFNDQSNVLKELSNMKLSRESEIKPKKSKKKGLVTLKKTWSSIINLAVGVPTLGHAHSKDNLAHGKSKKEHVDSLYTESMYSSLVGDIYKSRSTACIAAL